MNSKTNNRYTLIIIGAGTGGISAAAQLKRQKPDLDIAIIDPATYHYYQPAWTLVGGGAYRQEATRRPLALCLPNDTHHIAGSVQKVLPEARRVLLTDGSTLEYDYLIIAAGIQSNWDAIKGLTDTLGKNGVTSNYHYEYAPYTWDLIKNFKGGTAIFTQPSGAVKCPGAPQKALYLAADHFQRKGVRSVDLQFRSGAASIFGVPFYAEALQQTLQHYGAQAHYNSRLVEIQGEKKIAVFETRKNDLASHEAVAFDLLHVVPPQSAPDFILASGLADNNGWLDVDKHSLRHKQFSNIFGLGDCTSTPNSKTAAAIRNQTPVLVSNLVAALNGQANHKIYDGYAACPLTTSRGKVLLAEFTYGGTITPSLPLDPRKPRRLYWWLKRSFLPWFYWNILLRGNRLPDTHKKREYPAGVPSAQP